MIKGMSCKMKRHLLACTLIVMSGGVGYGQGLENVEKLQRLEHLAEESIAAGDAEEAANNSGKAALTASILATQQAKTRTTNWYKGATHLFRAQEQAYRAVALFQRSGNHIPASSGICHSIALGTKHAHQAQAFLSQSSPPSEQEAVYRIQSTEWIQTLTELGEDFECPR